jgi:hypothetical protein
LCVRSIDCTKDTRDELEKTIGKHLNESLHVITINKYLVTNTTRSATNEYFNVVTFSKEPPLITPNDSANWFITRALLAGGLAFFALALGKENSAPWWCTWCMLSKLQWTPPEHEKGELWSFKKINNIRDDVDFAHCYRSRKYIGREYFGMGSGMN